MKYSAALAGLFGAVAGLATACSADVGTNGDEATEARVASADQEVGTTSAPLTAEETTGIRVNLTKKRSTSIVSFGVPIPPGVLQSARTVRVLSAGTPIAAKVRELLKHYDGSGRATGVAAIQIQFPASAMPGSTLALDILWAGGAADSSSFATYSSVSADAAATAKTTVRSIAVSSGVYKLTEAAPVTKTLFTGRQPNVLATYPTGWLARSKVLGAQVSSADVAASTSTGTSFLSSQFNGFALSSMYADGYAYHADPSSVVDLSSDYSAWLYDRCATYMTAFSHFNDARYADFGFKSCGYYASHIGLSGTTLGIFTGKSTPDTKYSHARGMYAYYALTGDESARSALLAIANMWLNDTLFVAPYRAGHVRGADKLWTERLLATSVEGLLYGYKVSGDTKYLIALEEMIDTAYKHLTGSAADLATVNPGAAFPPQNCFIHSGVQQSEAAATTPWCSPWMSELMVESLLQYQDMTKDTRVDEMFIRLGRFLRDVGTAYFASDLLNDTFMKPSVCYVASGGTNRRRLVPLYGAGLNASRVRVSSGQYTDFEHCADASALSAAALRALKRTGQYDLHAIGPFSSEGASFLQLHHELLSCAERTLQEQTRSKRIPTNWTSKELAAGYSNPSTFILNNKIGFPSHMLSPTRKISWWFNTSMLQYKMLGDAGITIGTLTPGKIQPAGCQ